MTGRALVVRGDALHLPLADASVDLVVTSPPYWALRSYATGGHPGELGSEGHWRDWLARMVAATAEMARVLKPSGSIFVNLGDKYSGYTNGAGNGRNPGGGERGEAHVPDGPPSAPTVWGIPNKSLLLLPERYRIACVDQLGLTARAVIVWEKKNGLPESVRDRVRRSHEDFVHLTKGPRYYAATDELRELTPTASRTGRFESYPAGSASGSVTADGGHHVNRATSLPLNPLGKLPGSVWSIASEPLRIPPEVARALNLPEHYAAFGSEWPRRLILGWSPPGICVACGQGRWPVVERSYEPYRESGTSLSGFAKDIREPEGRRNGTGMGGKEKLNQSATILGYACACTPSTLHPGTGEPSGLHGRIGNVAEIGGYPNDGAGWPRGDSGHAGLGDRPKVGPWREYHLDGWQAPPTRPAVVLDPFCGTGTTVMVARALSRHGIGVDLSADYCRLARWRVFDSGAAGKAISRTNTERQGTLL